MASISTENRSPNKTHRKTDRKSSRNAKKCPRANKAKTGMNTPPQNCPTKKGILFQGIQCQTLASHFYAPPLTQTHRTRRDPDPPPERKGSF